MKKSEVLTRIRETSVVAVVRGNTIEEGLGISKACIEGGIRSIEMAYTNSSASKIIQELSQTYEDICVGAGTVLDAPTARNAIISGAKYIVSPSFNYETAIMCNRYGVPYIPGCMTITEIVTAMEAGSEMIKLFPGSAFGPDYVKAILSPLPHVSIMVTGGVKLDNIDQWFKSGVEAIGVGGEFNTLGAKGEFEEVKRLSNEYVNKVREAR